LIRALSRFTEYYIGTRYITDMHAVGFELAATWGRRPLLLLALAVVPIRSELSALAADPALLVILQLMDGFTGATLGVLTTLIIADLTNGTGRLTWPKGSPVRFPASALRSPHQ
jgi:MFS family permease